MEESLGAQYALQIAVHTLRDRCKNLQLRVSTLEEENVQLRVKCSQHEEQLDSLSELDRLRGHVTELTEQKEQYQDKIKMVSNENQDLWYKLGKLISVNKNLGDQLSKINETLKHHTSPQPPTTLIRSKTFTQDEPYTKFLQKNLETNERISLELENVSLKLTDSFSKQKIEMEKICSEIDDMQNNDDVITENFGFCFEDDSDDDVVDEFKYVMNDLKMLREEVVEQKRILKKNVNNLDRLRSKGKAICKICDNRKNSSADKATTTTDTSKQCVDRGTDVQIFCDNVQSSHQNLSETEKLCPICTKVFGRDVEFSIFERHVEEHFNPDISSYEML